MRAESDGAGPGIRGTPDQLIAFVSAGRQGRRVSVGGARGREVPAELVEVTERRMPAGPAGHHPTQLVYFPRTRPKPLLRTAANRLPSAPLGR